MIELLGRINPKAQDLLMLPPGFMALSQIDVAHGLGKVRGRGPRLLGRVMYAEQMEFAPALEYHLLARLKIAAKLENWHNIAHLPSVAKVSTQLYTKPKRCGKCKGRGSRQWAARVIVCPRCCGSSWEPIHNSDLAEAIGVSHSAYTRIWSKRMGLALDILAGWDRRCINGFSNAMR